MKKIALVTGGMGGLGTAICKALADSGHQVISTCFTTDDHKTWLEKTKKDGYSFGVVSCDVSSWDSVAQAIKETKEKYGQIDILINNAGITRDATIKKMTLDQWNAVIKTNLDSAFNTTKHVLDDMVERSWGRIVNISSINGQKGQFGQANYSAAKAGIHGLTMAVAQEVAKKGVTVNTVAPGYLGTEMVMAIPEEVRAKITAQIPVGRLGKPEEIAALIAYICSDLAGFMTGAEIAINGGQHMM